MNHTITPKNKEEVPYEVVCKTCNDQILRFWDFEQEIYKLPVNLNTDFITQITNNHAIRKHYNLGEDDVRFVIQRELKKRPKKPKWKMARRESIVV